jgi:PAS domain-containing protein
MPENKEKKSNKSDKNDDSPGDNATSNFSGFGLLSDSILRSLPIGIIAFDSDMKIIGANYQARRLLILNDYIDKSLAKGTDDKIWMGWTERLTSAISAGKPCTFDEVSYSSDGKTRLLRIVCASL